MNPPGLQVLFEPDHRVPLVDFQLILKTGAALDPQNFGGLSTLATLMVRSGTDALSRVEVPAACEARGARLSSSVSLSYQSFHLTCLREHAESAIALLSSLLQEPALRKQDLEFQQRDQQQERLARREEPRSVVSRAFSLAVFAEHPFARDRFGTELEMARMTVDDIRDFLSQRFVRGNLVVGCSGDVSEAEAKRFVDDHFSWVGEGDLLDDTSAVGPPGRRAVVVEMPGQAQSHVFLGTLGAIAGEADYDAWSLATIAFGGLFSSRLTQQIRERHGFSYEANARLYMSRQRNVWRTYSFPSNEHLAACIRVQLEMIASLREEGLGEQELEDTRRYIENSRAFDRETACKRLDPNLDEVIFDIPRGWYSEESARIQAITNHDIKRVLSRRLPDAQLCIAVAGPRGTAKIVEQAFEPDHMFVLTPEAVLS